MRKIQVTTAEVKAPAQVLLPNTYFIAKAVKAQLSVEELKSEVEALHNMGKINNNEVPIPAVVVDNVIDLAGQFLDELIKALEGEEDNTDNR